MTKTFVIALLIMMISLSMVVYGDTDENQNRIDNQGSQSTADTGNNHILVAYFSHSGNTCEIADQIHKKVGGDLFEIKTVNSYPEEYEAVKTVAMKEISDKARPKLSSIVNNMDSYNVVFIGYPIWWGTMPMAVDSFLTGYDLSGKKIIPFSTHEGSGLGSSVNDIKGLCPKSSILDVLPIRDSDINNSQAIISDWLSNIGIPHNG